MANEQNLDEIVNQSYVDTISRLNKAYLYGGIVGGVSLFCGVVVDSDALQGFGTGIVGLDVAMAYYTNYLDRKRIIENSQ